MDAREYWSNVEKKKTDLIVAHEVRKAKENFQGQPEDGFYLYTTSIENYQRKTTPGVVCQTDYRNAAKGIVDGMLRVSTSEEIASHLVHQAVLRAGYEREEINRNKKVFVTMTPQEAGMTSFRQSSPVAPATPIAPPIPNPGKAK